LCPGQQKAPGDLHVAWGRTMVDARFHPSYQRSKKDESRRQKASFARDFFLLTFYFLLI
jgi:hypothetical protein